MNECILNAFYVYVIFMVLIYCIKPNFLFYNVGDKCLFKDFGFVKFLLNNGLILSELFIKNGTFLLFPVNQSETILFNFVISKKFE